MATRTSRQFGSTSAMRRSGFMILALTTGCSAILGIEEAEVDPRLTAASGAGGSAPGADASSTHDSGAPDAVAPSGDGATQADSESADGSPESGLPSSVCQQYCVDITSYCNGDLRQYVDLPQCLKVCSLFPAGTLGVDGNSAACRGKYAAKARYSAGSELDAFCHKAGPGSDGTCGGICESFCILMMPTCTAESEAPYYFSSTSDCMSACSSLPDDPPYSSSDGTLPDTYTAQCRLFHATSAVMDPDEHCEHAMGVTMCDQKMDGGAD